MQAAKVRPSRDENWLATVLSAIELEGCCVVEGVLAPALIDEIQPAMYRCRERIVAEVGIDRLTRAGELGVLRLMLRFEPVFFQLLHLPELLAIVDATVSPTAILHLQNGIILPSYPPKEVLSVFQNRYHRDFPRYLNGYVASINALFAIDRFTRDNGATFVVPRSHRRANPPAEAGISAMGFPVECEAGSMLVFDSTLWHAAGANVSGRERLAINHQFTRSWIKQQIDYVRALGENAVLRQSPRTQQLLGYYTRIPASLDEYYRPESERIYRAGQG